MGRFEPFINTFTSGELSPRLVGRDDLDQYRRAARRLRNFIVQPQGGVTRRPGTWFVSAVHSHAYKSRLIPFRFSTDIAYVVELSHQVARFYVNGGLLRDGGNPVTVATPYAHTDLDAIQYAQEADVLYLVHPNYPPYKLSRVTPTSFTMAPVQFSKGRAPMGPFNVDTSIYISANAAGVTHQRRLTFSAAHGLTTADVGRPMLVYRYRKSASVKYRAAVYEIKQIVSATVIEVGVLWEYETGDGANIFGEDSYTWALGLFSATEGCRAITFHEGRLVYAGFKRKVDYIAMSVSDDFDNFENENIDPDLDDSFNDDKAIFRRTVSRDVNAIEWVASTGQALIVGTSGAEFIVKGTSDGIMTPAGTVVKHATSRGSEPHIAVPVEGGVFFIQRGGTVLRRIAYDFENDQFVSTDVTVLCDHLFQPGIEEVVYQQWPYSVLWMRRTDGRLLGLTFDSEQSVIAAHLHEIGGQWKSRLPAQVESLCVIPGKDEDELWMVVKRTIGGSTRRFVEVMSKRYEPEWKPDAAREELIPDLGYAMFLDSALSGDLGNRIYTITASSPAQIQTLFIHGLSVGDYVRIRGLGGWEGRGTARRPWGLAELNNRTFRVRTVISPNTFTIEHPDSGEPVDTSDLSPFEDPNETARIYREINMLSGLAYLYGATIDVWADGSYLGEFTVEGDTLELPTRASLIVIGFKYTSLLETMPISLGNPRISDRGRGQAVTRVSMLLRSSAGGKIGRGPSPSRMEDLIYRIGQDLLDQPAPPLTGWMHVSLPSSWEKEPTILVELDEPQPFTLLGMSIQTQSATEA